MNLRAMLDGNTLNPDFPYYVNLTIDLNHLCKEGVNLGIVSDPVPFLAVKYWPLWSLPSEVIAKCDCKLKKLCWAPLLSVLPILQMRGGLRRLSTGPRLKDVVTA